MCASRGFQDYFQCGVEIISFSKCRCGPRCAVPLLDTESEVVVSCSEIYRTLVGGSERSLQVTAYGEFYHAKENGGWP